MKVTVRTKNKIDLSPKIKEQAEEKLAKLDQFFNRREDLEANVLCKEYDDGKTIEITLPTRNILLRAEVKADTFLNALDLAIDKLETQIHRHKSKIYSSLKRRAGVSQYYATNSDFDLEKMKTELMVTNLVKSKSVELKPMTAEDAITQMEMLGHNFFVFLNVETNKVSVVYLRDDHDYGIIETSNSVNEW